MIFSDRLTIRELLIVVTFVISMTLAWGAVRSDVQSLAEHASADDQRADQIEADITQIQVEHAELGKSMATREDIKELSKALQVFGRNQQRLCDKLSVACETQPLLP